MLVTCNLPSDWKPGDFDPFPGGQEARHMGCCCPYQPVENGQITFDSKCKVHELEKVLKQ